jgi:hypothetical protein
VVMWIVCVSWSNIFREPCVAAILFQLDSTPDRSRYKRPVVGIVLVLLGERYSSTCMVYVGSVSRGSSRPPLLRAIDFVGGIWSAKGFFKTPSQNTIEQPKTPLFFDHYSLLPHTTNTYTMAKKAKKLKDKNAPKR